MHTDIHDVDDIQVGAVSKQIGCYRRTISIHSKENGWLEFALFADTAEYLIVQDQKGNKSFG